MNTNEAANQDVEIAFRAVLELMLLDSQKPKHKFKG